MIVAGWEGGVRIELDETEAYELADFLNDHDRDSTSSITDTLSARLADVLGIERGDA